MPDLVFHRRANRSSVARTDSEERETDDC